MFDTRTSELLRSAPSFENLKAEDLPKILTRQYALLVSARLRGTSEFSEGKETGDWSLLKIANAYEVIVSLTKDNSLRRAAAFVAATAHQMIARAADQNKILAEEIIFSRDRVSSSISAPILFMIAEQYADANEASRNIPSLSFVDEFSVLIQSIKDLTSGRVNSIFERGMVWRKPLVTGRAGSLDADANQALIEALIDGIDFLAAEVLSTAASIAAQYSFSSSQEAFRKILEICSKKNVYMLHGIGDARSMYAGPAHLASLLLAASETITAAALTKLPPLGNSPNSFWTRWLHFRSCTTPFLWPNHREATSLNFYTPGKSSVLILPTGAGKTTVSALKIAATLASGRSVVFLAPTHALVEQLSEDLEEIFPAEHFALEVSSDFDSMLSEIDRLRDIEIMTPERCLTILSFSPQSFEGVGLLVFDECHLLSPQHGKSRRALDSMLCLLTFNVVAPSSDMLFLSAMVKNGQQFAEWIGELTKRQCLAIDLLWKPSRQVRGVVAYDKTEIDEVQSKAELEQIKLNVSKGKSAVGLRTLAERLLRVTPYTVWGLQHNWNDKGDTDFFVTELLDEKVNLSGKLLGKRVQVNPNANSIAAIVARSAAKKNIKTIIFVNTKRGTVSLAEQISMAIQNPITLTDTEKEIWQAIKAELGDWCHSVFHENFAAVPHNSSMLRVERLLSERIFKRTEGSAVIVATPTLAQGLNLPAQLAIISGDKRNEGQTRVLLQPHELLNAAARAGRAGHLANGAVLLVPEPICTFDKYRNISKTAKEKLQSIFPENDRCVDITDPLDIILDRIMQGDIADRDVRYTIHRLAAFPTAATGLSTEKTLVTRSFGAYVARKRGQERQYKDSVEFLSARVDALLQADPSETRLKLASQSGLPIDIIRKLTERLSDHSGILPINIVSWIEWALDWIASDEEVLQELLGEVAKDILFASGKSEKSKFDGEVFSSIRAGLIAWVEGKPINQIEIALGGALDAEATEKRTCQRARYLVTAVIPRGFSYAISVIARAVDELGLCNVQPELSEELIGEMPGAIRRGFNSVHKLRFSHLNRGKFLTRVQAHTRYREIYGDQL